MSSSNIALPQTLRDKLRDTVLERFIDLIPEEQLQTYIDSEVKAFFDTEQVLALDRKNVSVTNGGYYRATDKDEFCLNITAKMTPFRQLVWSCVHEHIRPKLETMLKDEHNSVTKELSKWTEDVKPKVVNDVGSMLSSLAVSMSNAMWEKTLYSANKNAHEQLKLSLNSIGVNTNNIGAPYAPVWGT